MINIVKHRPTVADLFKDITEFMSENIGMTIEEVCNKHQLYSDLEDARKRGFDQLNITKDYVNRRRAYAEDMDNLSLTKD